LFIAGAFSFGHFTATTFGLLSGNVSFFSTTTQI